MASSLLIHYRPCLGTKLSWVLSDDQGNLQSPITSGSLADVALIAKGQHTTVLIDASCTSIESVRIPSNNRQRQLQAVPYALEDSLASDIDELYFALGKKQADEQIPVVSIDRQLFQSTIDMFKQAGIFVETLSADCLALPLQADAWTVLVHGNSALIKTGPNMGHFCDRDILPSFVPALIEQAQQPPRSLLFYHDDNDAHAADLLSNLDIALSIQSYSDHPLQVFAANTSDARQLNMLQGKYAPRRESSALLQPWKSVAAVAAVWLLLQLIYAGFEIKQLQHKNQQLSVDIEQAFKRAIPGTRNYTNMQKRMERRLNELRGGGSSDEEAFLELLSGAAQSIDSEKITIHGMVYNNRHIDMELQAKSLQALESVKNKMNSIRNIKTTLSTSVENDKVKGRLRLERQG